MFSSTTYLIDRNGNVNHTWSSDYFPGESVYLLENGTILRSIKISLTGGGSGGGVQKITWDNRLIWDFRFYSDKYLSTHDIAPLPNGDVLLLAWELKTRAEAIAAGRNPNTIQNEFKPYFIVEVRPTGPTTGDIVWEWHVWDHLIQDYDPGQQNYGIVANHPELIDINFGFDLSGTDTADWLHVNSIDYNPQFDQIIVSVRYFNEIWVIDHSTTTAEAATHMGGNSGKGGDLLYRWGNPVSYRAGTTGDQKFFQQHDATWITPGYPGEGHILVFNNGVNRPGGSYTSIDEIVPPINSTGQYYLENGSAFGPDEPIWVYTTDFFASYIGGAQRIKNGDTLICNGPAGKFYEVTPEHAVIWQYTNPYPNYFLNQVFKIVYVPSDNPSSEIPDLDCEGSLHWTDVPAGSTVNGSFQVQNIGGIDSFLRWKIDSYPIWGTWSFDPEFGENLSPEDGKITVNVSIIAPDKRNKEFNGLIKIINIEDPEDFDVIPIYLKTPTSTPQSVIVLHFIKNHFYFFPFLKIIYALLR
jgi:hypothetical protein